MATANSKLLKQPVPTVRRASRHSVLIVGLSVDVSRLELENIELKVAEHPSDANRILKEDRISVVVATGTSVPLLEPPLGDQLIIVVGDGPLTGAKVGPAFYRTSSNITAEHLAQLVRATLYASAKRRAVAHPGLDPAAVDFLNRLRTRGDLIDAIGLLTDTVRRFLGADRAWIVTFGNTALSRWKTDDVRRPELLITVPSEPIGLVGFAVATREPLVVTDVTNDARFVPAVDAPDGLRNRRSFLSVPLDIREQSIALAVVRNGTDFEFTEAEIAAVQTLLLAASPTLSSQTLDIEVSTLLRDEAQAAQIGTYREEALEHNARGWESSPSVEPRWLARGMPTFLMPLVIALGLLMLAASQVAITDTVIGTGALHERPAIRVLVPGGIVRSIHVAPGDQIDRGALLVRLEQVNQRFVVDVRADEAGVVGRLLASSGQVVDKGSAVATIWPTKRYELLASFTGPKSSSVVVGGQIRLVPGPGGGPAIVLRIEEIVDEAEGRADIVGTKSPTVIARSLLQGPIDPSVSLPVTGRAEAPLQSQVLWRRLTDGLLHTFRRQ